MISAREAKSYRDIELFHYLYLWENKLSGFTPEDLLSLLIDGLYHKNQLLTGVNTVDQKKQLGEPNAIIHEETIGAIQQKIGEDESSSFTVPIVLVEEDFFEASSSVYLGACVPNQVEQAEGLVAFRTAVKI